MITTLLHHRSGLFQNDIVLDDIDSIIADKGQVLWLDIQDPTEADFLLLSREFGFHELALEDARKLHQRPKVEEYDSFYFVVCYALEFPDGSDQLRTHELAMFLGENYLVTVHEGPNREISEASERWQRSAHTMEPGVGPLLYALLDSVVDGHFPVVDQIAERVEELEEAIFERGKVDALVSLFSLKKALLTLRRVVAPERDVLNTLLRRDLPLLGPVTLVYLRDVYDHLLRITDSIDIYQDLLTSALDAHLSMTSNRLNETMRVLTALSAILMSAALVTGVYGMNFAHMPELGWRYGYLWSLGLMVALAVVLAGIFKKSRWL